MAQSATTLQSVPSRAVGTYRARSLTRKFRSGEAIITGLLFFSGAVSIFTTLGIVVILGNEALLFFNNPEMAPNPVAALSEFFFSFRWQPQVGDFGVWALVTATVSTTLVAMLVAVPLGVSAAIYLSEYATPQARGVLKPTLELLAGIPTVVYGFFALTFMTPILRAVLGDETVQIYNNLAAGLVMGIMIMPLVCSMSEDALSAVPRALREGAYGLGATKFETATQVVVPAALSGLVAAFIIGVSRAIGETMIVAIAAGASSPRTLAEFNILAAAETITGHIARISGGDLSYASIDYESLFALALLLFLITLMLNLLSRALVSRFREAYD
jgi:phosphate transport system permease protein